MLVGIPSFNNAATIGHVVVAAVGGLARYFPNRKGIIINSDGGSTDGTQGVFQGVPIQIGLKSHTLTYQGIPGKGTAFKALFEIGMRLGVKAVVVVDSDLRSITPEWIQKMGSPVLEGGYGLVTPLYSRHKYDGTITNAIAYPLTRALYGLRVRQPIGGDFGLSSELVGRLLEMDVWDTDVARFGIDIFLTTTAIYMGIKIGQAPLGAKIHDVKDPAATLGPMFRQVVGTLFGLMKTYQGRWPEITGSTPVDLLGSVEEAEPEPVKVTLPALTKNFRDGFGDHFPFYQEFISPEILKELEKLRASPEDLFHFPASLWAKIVYEFAVAYNQGCHPPTQVVDALTPLYFGRTASFVMETRELSTQEAERVIENVAEQFEKEKKYLIKRWSQRIKK
ncbi:glycosyltransferase [candidate division KSB1 bacterium]|nr:glycosyltransferase [candidate division KSB1 bacterium]